MEKLIYQASLLEWGQRVLSGVANTITKEVFSELEKHIEENREA